MDETMPLMKTIKDYEDFYKLTKKQVVVSRLSETILAPFQLALDIAIQLDERLVDDLCKTIKIPLVEKHAGLDYEYWIDYDSIGKVSYIKALNLFEQLKTTLEGIIVLLIEGSIESLSEDNKIFVDYLKTFTPNITIHFCTPNGPNKFKVQALTPLCDYLFSGGEHWRSPARVCFSNPLCSEKNSQDIMNYAWMLTHFDAIDLAKNIFKIGFESSKDPQINNQYLICLQATRVGLQQYDDVMSQVAPKEFFSKEIFESFAYSKAYAGVLSRNFDTAGEYFKALNIDENLAPNSIQNLYRLNIYALFLFHANKRDAALAIEKLILENLYKFSDSNTIYIKYINALNLSRVYRASKDFVKVDLYCEMAYEAIYGLKIESDHVYFNLNYASIFEEKQNYKEAFYSWLRAAVHWQSMRCPLALAWRPIATLLGRDFRFNMLIDPKLINNIFIIKLTELADKAGISLTENTNKQANFDRLENNNYDLSKSGYVATQGLSVLISEQKSLKTKFPHQCSQLNSLLVSMLENLLQITIPSDSNLIIDSNRGFGILTDEVALAKRAFALNMTHYKFDGETKKVSDNVNESNLLKSSAALYRLNMNNKKVSAQFKRYHADYDLGENESTLLSTLIKDGPLPIDLIKKELGTESINRLYQNNIIDFCIVDE